LSGVTALYAQRVPAAPAAPAAPPRDPLYRGYRFPAEIISHAVWLYFRFHLSRRDIEDLLAERGILVSYEAIRRWCHTFGPTLASGLRRCRRRAAGKWHLDEVQLKIKGQKYWLWRAVDSDGLVLDILVQDRRDQGAAERCLRRVVGGEEAPPRVVVTDKRASYPPAIKRVLPGVEHRRHKRLNNRAENSHRPVRKRERVLQRFKSPGHAQRFLETFSAVPNHFRPRRHLLRAAQHRLLRTERFSPWRDAARLPLSA
jgi:putative transposase